MSRGSMKKLPTGQRAGRRNLSEDAGNQPIRPTAARAMHGRQQVRITGGTMRSRQVRFPSAPGLRPTPDRVRETLFNWLGQDLSGWRVLDLFAGSGILGMEALSRGASWLGVVEQSARVVDEIRRNMATLTVPTDRVRIWRADATTWLKQAGQALGGEEPVDLVFLDPPFGRPELLETVLGQLIEADWLAPAARLYIEQSAARAPMELPGWVIDRRGQAGESLFMLWVRTTGASSA